MFWWWRTWFTSVGFLCQTFLDNRCGVAKGIVHVVGGRENVVRRFFKTECGGCHVTIDRCSGVFPNEYGFGGGERGLPVLGFCAKLFLITDAVLLKE